MRYFLLIIILCGCYNEKKAQQQFSKAAITYPKIPAEYCSNYYPIKDTLIKGDTIVNLDTLYVEGNTVSDTVINHDTVSITTIRTLPSKIITNTVHITDTITREGGKTAAQLRSCEIDKSKLTDLLVKKTNESNNYKGKARKRGLIMWSLIGLIILVVGINVYLKIKKI